MPREGSIVSANTEQPTVRLELCVRSLARTDQARQDTLIDRLEALAADDRVSSFDVTVWGDQLPLDRSPRTNTGRRLCHLLGRFEQWADQPGRAIRPFFETRDLASELTDTVRECQVMSLPEFALAEFHDDELVWISPHQNNNSTHSVDDHLDAIAATDPRRESPDRSLEGTVPREKPPVLERSSPDSRP